MIVFKEVDQYDRNTGKKIGTTKVYDHSICDFTGEKIDGDSVKYEINYQSFDPCYGDGEGEGWLYDYERGKFGDEDYDNMNGYHYELFGQGWYTFLANEIGMDVVPELIELAQKECENGILSLDHLLR